MTLYYILVFGILLLFGATVIWALWWAIRGGQFSDFQKGATSIFDEDEPIGEVTDHFTDRCEEMKREQQAIAENEDQEPPGEESSAKPRN